MYAVYARRASEGYPFPFSRWIRRHNADPIDSLYRFVMRFRPSPTSSWNFITIGRFGGAPVTAAQHRSDAPCTVSSTFRCSMRFSSTLSRFARCCSSCYLSTLICLHYTFFAFHNLSSFPTRFLLLSYTPSPPFTLSLPFHRLFSYIFMKKKPRQLTSFSPTRSYAIYHSDLD